LSQAEASPNPEKRILLVEDERELREVLALGLRRAGYTVEVAVTVADAELLLKQKRYALLIADWRLPDGNGSTSRIGPPSCAPRPSLLADISSLCRPAPQTGTGC